MQRRAAVLTVSDRVATGVSIDASGPAVAQCLVDHGFNVLSIEVVADGIAEVTAGLNAASTLDVGLVVTTGGTGFGPRDLTPEATGAFVERDAPGLAEVMRASSPLGALSRGRCGTKGSTLICNVPGSPKGAVESLNAIAHLLGHALDLLANAGTASPHPHPPEKGGNSATSSLGPMS